MGNGRFHPKDSVRTFRLNIDNLPCSLYYTGKHNCKLGAKQVFGKKDLVFVTVSLSLPSKNLPKEVYSMLIIDSKDCENIDKALKKYKKKFEKAKILVQLRDRQSFTKPSVRRRAEVLKAVYKQQVASGKFEV